MVQLAGNQLEQDGFWQHAVWLIGAWKIWTTFLTTNFPEVYYTLWFSLLWVQHGNHGVIDRNK